MSNKKRWHRQTTDKELNEYAQLKMEANEHKLAVQAAAEILEQYERDLQKIKRQNKRIRIILWTVLVADLITAAMVVGIRGI